MAGIKAEQNTPLDVIGGHVLDISRALRISALTGFSRRLFDMPVMSICSLASHLDRITSMSLLGTSGFAMHVCLARLLGGA